MPRAPLHTADIKIDQKSDILDHANRDAEIVIAENMPSKAWADDLAFMEEPMTIRIEPSAEKNAASAVPVWVNGRGAEVFQNNRWDEIKYLPVGRVLTTKRKFVEVLARAKIDTINTMYEGTESPMPRNAETRVTTAVCTFSVIEDRNPKGPAWLTEMMRRNF